MLTRQSNTQVYSPFGTYVVEQHDGGFHKPQHVPEPPVAEQAEPQSDKPKDMSKAA